MKILLSLLRIKVLSLRGLFGLLKGIYREGVTLHALLYYCAAMFGAKVALLQGNKKLNYIELYQKVRNLASNLSEVHQLKEGDKVALLSKNSISFCITLFAVSRTGAHVVLLNPEMSENQLKQLHETHQFDRVVFENNALEEKLNGTLQIPSLLIEGENSLTKLIQLKNEKSLERRKSGNLVVLTSGTTGVFKTASRKQNLFDFLYPLSALVNTIKLHTFQSVYIPVPVYHGFGLASLVSSVLFGTEIHLTKGFDAKEATNLISKFNIDGVALVPTMLSGMLNTSPESLKNLKRIISGGASLTTGLISDTTQKVGSILYNLYGTTEAGFCVLGTPQDLAQNPNTLGRAIEGVKIRVTAPNTISELEVKSRWSTSQRNDRWVKTGDLALIDESKLIFLKGRTDSMIVSGGENVYPMDLETVLSNHPKIDNVSVIGVSDLVFGSRLKAFVVLKKDESISEVELTAWLKSRVTRYQMPVLITFLKEFPLSSIGKVNKTLLDNKEQVYV